MVKDTYMYNTRVIKTSSANSSETSGSCKKHVHLHVWYLTSSTAHKSHIQRVPTVRLARTFSDLRNLHTSSIRKRLISTAVWIWDYSFAHAWLYTGTTSTYKTITLGAIAETYIFGLRISLGSSSKTSKSYDGDLALALTLASKWTMGWWELLILCWCEGPRRLLSLDPLPRLISISSTSLSAATVDSIIMRKKFCSVKWSWAFYWSASPFSLFLTFPPAPRMSLSLPLPLSLVQMHLPTYTRTIRSSITNINSKPLIEYKPQMLLKVLASVYTPRALRLYNKHGHPTTDNHTFIEQAEIQSSHIAWSISLQKWLLVSTCTQ